MIRGNTELRKLLIAQVPADFADWLDFVAIGALLAFNWQVDTFVFALLAVALGLPYLIVGPFAGGLVDRTDTRRVLILSNFGRGIMTALFFFAPGWPALLSFVLLRSAVDSFFTPAKQSAIQALVGPDSRTKANSASHAINQASKVVAPSLGGTLLIWYTPSAVFLVNAGISLFAAALLFGLNPIPSRRRSADGQAGNMRASLRGGAKLIAGDRVLRAAISMMAAGYFAMFFYDTLIAPLTRDLSFTQTHLGFALACVGGGGVLGAAVMAMGREPKRPFLVISLAMAGSGALIGWLGVSELLDTGLALPLFLLIFFGAGVCTAMAVIPFRTIIQNHTSDESIGQITALSEAVNTLALLSAPFVGAWIASLFTVGAAFIAGGAVMLFVAVWAFAIRNRK